jgi:peptidoglycan/LPS O-acetylase OafA/YrhL
VSGHGGSPPSHAAPQRLDGVEALRAVAALMIVLHHLVLLPSPNLALPAGLGVIKDWFGMGVPLFYALSGFVLAHGYLGRLGSSESVRRFYVRRLFRIAPLFYFMLVVWLLASQWKWGSFRSSLSDIFLNVLFVFGLVPGKHESIVWAGWSIGVEMLFYAVFPLIAAVVATRTAGVLAWIVAVFVGSACFDALTAMNVGSFAYMNLVTHLPNFLIGVLAFLVWRDLGFRTGRLAGFLLLVAAFALAGLLAYSSGFREGLAQVKGIRLDLYAWGLAFMALTLSVCVWPNRLIVNRVSTYLGRISFSLYLWHPLLIVLLLDVIGALRARLQGDGLILAACTATVLTVLVAVSSLSYRFIELPGMNYGKRLTRPRPEQSVP